MNQSHNEIAWEQTRSFAEVFVPPITAAHAALVQDVATARAEGLPNILPINSQDIYNRDDMRQAEDKAAQEMFEACVKELCPYCSGRFPELTTSTFLRYNLNAHLYPNDAFVEKCKAHDLRLAFPTRSAQMNEGDTK